MENGNLDSKSIDESYLINDLNYNFYIIESSLNSLQHKLNHHSFLLMKNNRDRNLENLIHSIEEKLDCLKKINKHQSDSKSEEHFSHRQREVMKNINYHVELDKNFKKSIINLMVLTLHYWETSTQRSKLELAECSKQWKVYINNGRLIARTMERYLSINKLPKYPRVKNVIKTADFVLKQCELDDISRKKIENSLQETQELEKRIALLKAEDKNTNTK